MKDRVISAQARVKCPCSKVHSFEELRAEKATPSGSDVPRWNFKCPTSDTFLVYGSIVMGLYAKSGIEVIEEVYTH